MAVGRARVCSQGYKFEGKLLISQAPMVTRATVGRARVCSWESPGDQNLRASLISPGSNACQGYCWEEERAPGSNLRANLISELSRANTLHGFEGDFTSTQCLPHKPPRIPYGGQLWCTPHWWFTMCWLLEPQL